MSYGACRSPHLRARDARPTRTGCARIALALAALLALAHPAVASVESELAYHRGIIAYGEGNLEQAAAEFERVLVDEPGDASALNYLGLITTELEQWDRAIDYYEQALALTPDDLELRVELGSALLEAGRNERARDVLDQAVEADPSNARAQLLSGIALYRLRDYRAAKQRLDRSVRLDPDQDLHARYYVGLVNSFLGNMAVAADAFDVVRDQSPLHPLGQSASQLRREVDPFLGPRAWEVNLALGTEFDSNPRIAGTLIDRDSDIRGVARLATSYRFLSTERFEVAAGYDAYVSLHKDVNEVDVQTHLGWLAGGTRLGPLRASLRYDYSFTFLDLTDKFQGVNRVTPTVLWTQARWTATEVSYQYLNLQYYRDNFVDALDQDADQHVVGVSQYLFPQTWVETLRVGFVYDHNDPQGTEFEYDGWDVTARADLRLPLEVDLVLDYRYGERDYDNVSFFAPRKRSDKVHRVSVNLVRPLTEKLELSLYGSFRNNGSNIGVYDYDRAIGGVYLNYRF